MVTTFRCTGACGPLLDGRMERGDYDVETVHHPVGLIFRGHPFCWEFSDDGGKTWTQPEDQSDGLMGTIACQWEVDRAADARMRAQRDAIGMRESEEAASEFQSDEDRMIRDDEEDAIARERGEWNGVSAS